MLLKRWEVLISHSSMWLFLALRFVKCILEIFWELSGGPEAVINVCGFKIAYLLHQKCRFNACKNLHIIIKPVTASPAGKYTLLTLYSIFFSQNESMSCPNYITAFEKIRPFEHPSDLPGVYSGHAVLVPGCLEACPSLSHWQFSLCEVFI